MRIPAFLLTLLLSGGTLFACGPAEDSAGEAGTTSELASAAIPGPDGGDLYDGLEGLRDGALKRALYDRVKGHRALGYDRARTFLIKTAVLSPNSLLECVYTGRTTRPDGTFTPGDFNTEHSWPQSMGADSEPAKSDLHHLFPVDGRTNSARSNYPYGDVTCIEHDAGAPSDTDAPPACSFQQGGSALGRTTDGAIAFEVRPQKRGDIARAQFYFAIRYQKAILPRVEPTLKQWHREDPVDDAERFKNEGVAREQRNRNPFVDHPEYVDAIADF